MREKKGRGEKEDRRRGNPSAKRSQTTRRLLQTRVRRAAKDSLPTTQARARATAISTSTIPPGWAEPPVVIADARLDDAADPGGGACDEEDADAEAEAAAGSGPRVAVCVTTGLCVEETKDPVGAGPSAVADEVVGTADASAAVAADAAAADDAADAEAEADETGDTAAAATSGSTS